MKIGIVVNAARPGAQSALTMLLVVLAETMGLRNVCLSGVKHLELSFGARSASIEDLCTDSELIFSLGGDGTMLGAARAIVRTKSSAKLIGINLGKLGFIAENQPEEIGELIDELKAGSLIEEERRIVCATVSGVHNSDQSVSIRRGAIAPSHNGEICLTALNEIVVDNFGSTRMLTFELRVDDALLGVLRADGLIVATPTGSTGYAVSAGGPIIEPSSPVLLITPIAPHSLNVRPVVVPDHVTISIRVTSEESEGALIVADGQEEVVAKTPASVTITRGERPVVFLHRKQNQYFDRLRTKLLWSFDARDSHEMRR
jgi:NAD+ kinase